MIEFMTDSWINFFLGFVGGVWIVQILGALVIITIGWLRKRR